MDKYLVMLFDLWNVLAIFHHFVSKSFQIYVIIFLDNILVFFKKLPFYLAHIKISIALFLGEFTLAGEIFVEQFELPFLGYIISFQVLRKDPETVSYILSGLVQKA